MIKTLKLTSHKYTIQRKKNFVIRLKTKVLIL